MGASYELYIHKPEKKDYEPDKTDYSHYCKGCFEEITKCALCTTKMSTRFCLSCNESYCLTCFKSIHEKGKKRLHRWSSKPTLYRWAGFEEPAPLCCECWSPDLQARATIKCTDCHGDSFCNSCFSKIHKSTARKKHVNTSLIF